ncbi:MAG: helix-turn-helix domain-containing protein [Egibacteraceae bacterium]
MLHTPDAPVGQRIAHWRHRRGLTQQVLAGLVGRSVPWLSLIERGDRTVEKIADLLALANVLKVEPGDLIGGVELPPNGGGPLDPPRGIPAIRRALFAVHLADRETPDAVRLRAQGSAPAMGPTRRPRALSLSCSSAREQPLRRACPAPGGASRLPIT